MSEYIPTKQYDNFSSYSFRSQISNLSFTSPIPLPQNPDHIPTNEEIGQSYDEIERSLPDVETDHLVQALFDKMIAPKIPEKTFSQYGSERSNYSHMSKAQSNLEGKKPKKEGKSKKKKDKKPRTLFSMVDDSVYGENEQNLKKAQNWTKQDNKEHHLKPNILNSQMITTEEQIKYSQKKLAAKAFCDRGYNLDNMKEEVWQTDRTVLQLDKKRYMLILTAVMNQSYRKLENFLIDDCHRNIKPLINPQMKALIPLLFQSRLKMDESEYLTLRKFIRVTYDLGSVSLFEQEAVKLYIKIQELLRGKIGKMKLDRYYRPEKYTEREILRSPGRFLNQRIEKQTLWTKQLELQLVDLMLQLKTLAKARDEFKKKYGIHAILNNCVQLKARFLKIIRLQARRLQKIAAQHASQLPALLPFDDEKVKVLIRHHTARECRWALARMYRADKYDQQLTADAILKVNEFCVINESNSKPDKKDKEPAINSVNDKIKYNIKETRKMLHSVIGPSEKIGFKGDLVFMKKNENNYQHIVSLEHKDKLHYFRKTGQLNKKGGFDYEQKPPQLKALEMQDGDLDSEHPVYLSDDDYVSEQETKGGR